MTHIKSASQPLIPPSCPATCLVSACACEKGSPLGPRGGYRGAGRDGTAQTSPPPLQDSHQKHRSGGFTRTQYYQVADRAPPPCASSGSWAPPRSTPRSRHAFVSRVGTCSYHRKWLGYCMLPLIGSVLMPAPTHLQGGPPSSPRRRKGRGPRSSSPPPHPPRRSPTLLGVGTAYTHRRNQSMIKPCPLRAVQPNCGPHPCPTTTPHPGTSGPTRCSPSHMPAWTGRARTGSGRPAGP